MEGKEFREIGQASGALEASWRARPERGDGRLAEASGHHLLSAHLCQWNGRGGIQMTGAIKNIDRSFKTFVPKKERINIVSSGDSIKNTI